MKIALLMYGTGINGSRKMKKSIIYIIVSLFIAGITLAQNEFVRTKRLTDSLNTRQATIQSNTKGFIADSLQPIKANIATKLNITAFTDSINARGFVTIPYVKQLISDSLKNIGVGISASVIHDSLVANSQGFLRGIDTLSLSNRINTKLNISVLTDSLNPIRASIATKLNSADTLSLSNRINTKLTTSLLTDSLNLIRGSIIGKMDISTFTDSINARGFSTVTQTKQLISDSLQNISTGASATAIHDSLVANSQGFLKGIDTLSLSNRINTKLNTSTLTDSLNPIRGDITNKLDITALTDTLNTNIRGWRNQIETKQDAIDTISTVQIDMREQLENLASTINSSISSLSRYIDSLFTNLNNRLLVLENQGSYNPDPTAPTNLTASAQSSSSILISFTPSTSSFDSTIIEYSLNNQPNSWTVLVKLDSGVTSYTHTNLSSSTTYWYRARCFKIIQSIYIYSQYTASYSAATQIQQVTAIYNNTGNNLTDWTISSESGNSIASVSTGGNPDNTLSFVWGGANDGNIGSYSYSALGSLWLSADVFIPTNFRVATVANQSYTLMEIKSGTSSVVTISMRGNLDTLANQWRISGSGVSTTNTGNGFVKDQFVKLQIYWKYAGGIVKIYAGNTLVYSGSGLSMSDSTSDKMQFGGTSGYVPKGTIKIDNIVLSADSGGGTLKKIFYVANNASGSGDGTIANPFTLSQAVAGAKSGNTYFLKKGIYDLSSLARLTFSASGTIDSPIVWMGEIGSDISVDSTTSSGTQSTVLINNTYPYNEIIRVSGKYNVFKKMIMIQNYSTNGNNFLNILGDGTTLDSVAFKYPSNVANSANHSIYVTSARDVTFRYSTFRNGSRCIIWVIGTTKAPNNFVMDNCTLKGSSNHPAIQIMPMTDATSPAYIDSFQVKNNTFIDNGYGQSLYVRWSRYFAVYNNLFIRSGKAFDGDHHSVPTNNGAYDTVDTKGSIIAFNTLVGNAENAIGTKSFQNLINMNNIFYAPTGFSSYILSYDRGYRTPYITPINLRMKIDYNLYYEADRTYSWRFDATNGTSRTTSSYSTFNAYDGNNFNQYSFYDTDPQFVNVNSDDYRLSTNRTGKSIKKTDGFFIDILYDKNGNLRDTTNPTIGCFEYMP